MIAERMTRTGILLPWACLTAFTLTQCKPLLGPKEDQEIKNHAALIAKCQIEARMALPGEHPLDVFDACMARGAPK